MKGTGVLVVGTLVGAVLIFGGAPSAWAQEELLPDTAVVVPVYTLAEIVVLGKRNAITRAATVHQIERDGIDELGIRSPRDAMEHVPGVYFSRNIRNENSFLLRGFEQRQISVFVDGVPVSLAYDGLVDVSQFVGADLERAQISHGFSSLLYGANSLGGAVNLLTRPPSTQRRVAGRFEGSDHGRVFGSVEASGGTHRLRLGGSAALERARSFSLSRDFTPTPDEEGGERANSSYHRRRAGVTVHYLITDSHQVVLNLSGTDNRFDVPPNVLAARPRYWRFPVWQRALASIRTRHVLASGVGLRTTWFHDRYRNVLRSFDDDTYTTQERGYAFDSEYDDYSYGVNLYPSLSVLPMGTTDAVISYRRDVHRQRNGNGDVPFERHSTDLLTVGLEQDVDWADALSMMMGVNLNHLRPLMASGHPATDPQTQVNAQGAVQVALGSSVSSRMAVSRKSRFPTMKELYDSHLGRNLPNPGLRSERAVHQEVGLDVASGGWQGSVAGFRSEVRDLIAAVAVGEGLVQLQNINRARMEGFEVDLRHRMRVGWVGANYTYLRSLNRSPDRDSDWLPYRPAHRVNALARAHVRERVWVGGEVSYTAGQHYQNPDSREWERLNDMLWISFRMEQELPGGLGWYLRMDNVLDAAYFSEFGNPLPGREVTVGIRIGR
jgi:iron complex outermembrane recepter protein